MPASIEERRVVGGHLKFSEDDGKEVDCTKTMGGIIIPDVDKVRVIDMKSNSGAFILVVQRYDIYRSLAVARNDNGDDLFYKRYPCIVVNVEEDPDLVTKLFLKKLKTELKLPLVALVDSSPDGVKIISTLSECCGCDINWLGITPSEMDEYGIPNDPRIRIPMTDGDLKTLKDLMENDDFVKKKMKNPKWFEDQNLKENDDLKERMKNLKSTLMENDFVKEKMKNAKENGEDHFEEEKMKNTKWFEELTLMKKTKTKTRVEDFDVFKNYLLVKLSQKFELMISKFVALIIATI